jgi:Tfp pilus assembly PilM family ATPase
MSALASTLQRFTPKSNAVRIGPIGLECSLTALHLVQMEVSANHVISVSAVASIPYPESREALLASPKKMRALVRQAMATDRFRGKQVVTTLPAADTRIMPVTYHVHEGQSGDAALAAVLKERIEGDLKDFVIDYLPVRSGKQSGERLAIVAIARHDAVIRYLELLRKSGLETRQLEIGPAAIRRVVSAIGPRDQHANVLAINFGRNESYLTVISGSRLLLDQSVKIGETALLEGVAMALEMPVDAVRTLVSNSGAAPDAEQLQHGSSRLDVDIAETLQEIIKPMLLDLVEEINRVLVYTASQTHGQSVSQIYLMGSLARWNGMDQLLDSLVKLPVKTIPDPLEPFGRKDKSAEDSKQPRPEIAVATGLALNGMLENDGH